MIKERKKKHETNKKSTRPTVQPFGFNSHETCMLNAETANFVNVDFRWAHNKDDSTFECQYRQLCF